MQHLTMLQQQTAWIEKPIAADPAASEKQKSGHSPLFRSGLAGAIAKLPFHPWSASRR
ncbi:hypothetical protein MF410_18570 [Rhizobium sp. C104]|uniref:hypothetical protein n=1 Tax=Rhizobium sp. C104 TaxID=2917727 RepID=UPI001EF81BD4|nr:hypothetical protein [Rhizobium sp. C104]ULJ77959.1 hypothetical protein MF410_18570 [Rhizobium sp. C104]